MMTQHKTNDKSNEDTISENEYTMRMRSASTDPQDDSPGDSESDAGSEFEMGLEYIPNVKSDPNNPVETPVEEPIDEPGEPSEPTNPTDPAIPILVMNDIPESAKVVSSDQPSPWMDMGTASSTH